MTTVNCGHSLVLSVTDNAQARYTDSRISEPLDEFATVPLKPTTRTREIHAIKSDDALLR